MFSFSVESDDLKLHGDSSEDIACARELLTLGQHNEVKRDSFIVSKESSRSKLSSAAHHTGVGGPVQRVIVSRVPGPRHDGPHLAHRHTAGNLNLDGNISDTSDNSSEDEEEEDCDEDVSAKNVSKMYSISNLLLSRNHAACPKSTVEDSCCNPKLLNKEEKRHLSWTKRKKLKANDTEFLESPMNGGLPPLAPDNERVRPCKVILPKLSVDTDTVVNSEELSAKDRDNYLEEGEKKPCDTKMASNNTINDATAATNISSLTKPSYIAVSSQPPQPAATFISSGQAMFGSTTITSVASQAQVMAMPLAQNPVLVLSGAPTLSGAGNMVTTAGLPGNLVLGSFPGQMTAIPFNKGQLLGTVGGQPVQPGQAINIQTSDVIKVPVALNGGGVVLAAPPGPQLSTLSLPQHQPGQTTVLAGGQLAPAPGQTVLAAVQPQFIQPPQPQAAAAVTTVVSQASEKLEATVGEDGSMEWKCKVCSKVCPSEHELVIHKKRHKIDDPLVCQFCQRSYVDQHRFEVHVRTHTGETPFHCELCGKGFRDDRKMKLHMARHNSGLSHKCHLCPRSFEGPKALAKHIKAHEMGRYVAPKVIQRQDGTLAMALPEDPNATKKAETVTQQPPVVAAEAVPVPVAAAPSGSGHVTIVSQPQVTVMTMPVGAASEVKVEPPAILPVVPVSSAAAPAVTTIAPKPEDNVDTGDPGVISLSVDDLYQYSVAQTSVDTPATTENVDIHDKLSEGASKTVPLGLDEFMAASNEFEKPKSKTVKKAEEHDVSDFPDLLDSDHSLATLNSNFDYNQYDASDEKIDQLLKTATIKEEESGLTFATLGGLDPMYNNVDLSSLNPVKQEPVVVAKRSSAPPSALTVLSDPVKVEEPVLEPPQAAVLAPAPAPVAAPVTQTLTPMVVTPASLMTPAPAPDPSSGLTFTIQYPGTVAAPAPAVASAAPVLPQQPDPSVMSAEEPEAGDEPPQMNVDVSQIKPILPDVDPSAHDPLKDTFTYTTNAGVKIDVPTIITSGYDFENLTCLFCEKQQFKNDKTLINHLLNHFGVAPKMATCPICGLSLQKKSFARHVRLHGDVKPEVCPYCKKEFREKRSLEKHIRAIHEAERPFPCEHCTESFRNQIELKNHINRHLKDYPFKCDVCSMTFQKQEALTTHYRLHTGEKPFVCPICDKKFTSEKNKRVHVLRHQGSLPHKCSECNMTFQSKSHLDKHALSHNRKTQVISAKINTFLESFGASLEEFGLDDMGEGAGGDISLHSANEAGDIEDASIRLSVDNLPDTDNLEAAAAEAAFAFGGDLPDDFIKFDGTESQDSSEKGSEFGTPEPPASGVVSGSNTGSAPSLVNGLTEDEAERMAKAELASEIPLTPDGTYLCKYCNTKLGNKRSYIIHLRRHAGMLNFKCKYCTKTFQGRVKLNRHMNTHFRDGSNVTPPPQATATAPGTTTINNSLLLAPPPPPSGPSSATTTITPVPANPAAVTFNCTMCSKIFADKGTLQEHTRMHLIEDVKAKFSSPVSKEKSKALSSSSVAVASAPSVAPAASGSSEARETRYSYTCNLCNQVFMDSEGWRTHKGSHGNKTWKCKYCSLLFEDRNQLADHITNTHSISRGKNNYGVSFIRLDGTHKYLLYLSTVTGTLLSI